MNEIIEHIGKCRGHIKAVSAKELETLFKVKERTIRDMVVEAIEKEHALIGSCERGYFLIICDEDYAVARQYLVSPFNELKKRIGCLEFNYKVNQSAELPLNS